MKICFAIGLLLAQVKTPAAFQIAPKIGSSGASRSLCSSARQVPRAWPTQLDAVAAIPFPSSNAHINNPASNILLKYQRRELEKWEPLLVNCLQFVFSTKELFLRGTTLSEREARIRKRTRLSEEKSSGKPLLSFRRKFGLGRYGRQLRLLSLGLAIAFLVRTDLIPPTASTHWATDHFSLQSSPATWLAETTPRFSNYYANGDNNYRGGHGKWMDPPSLGEAVPAVIRTISSQEGGKRSVLPPLEKVLPSLSKVTDVKRMAQATNPTAPPTTPDGANHKNGASGTFMTVGAGAVAAAVLLQKSQAQHADGDGLIDDGKNGVATEGATYRLNIPYLSKWAPFNGYFKNEVRTNSSSPSRRIPSPSSLHGAFVLPQQRDRIRALIDSAINSTTTRQVTGLASVSSAFLRRKNRNDYGTAVNTTTMNGNKVDPFFQRSFYEAKQSGKGYGFPADEPETTMVEPYANGKREMQPRQFSNVISKLSHDRLSSEPQPTQGRSKMQTRAYVALRLSEEELAARYAALPLGERAYQILVDLGMVTPSCDPVIKEDADHNFT